MWVANASDNSVTKLKGDGTSLGVFAVGGEPFGLASDGSYIWVANRTTANATKLRASDGASLGTFPVGNFPTSVAFGGANV
jgi:DNA-binding beta-propeller fold protein YncE